MSRPRYSAAHKIKAVRRVTEDGCSVCDVAREMGVSEGSLFFWVRRHRQIVKPSMAATRLEATPEIGSLVAYLRRARSG